MAGTAAIKGSETLLQCIYVSTAFHPLSDSELVSLLERSRTRNSEVGITGVLIYCEGSFLQVFEGPAQEVNRLFERILGDSRHYGVVRLVHEQISKRTLGQLSMGFVKSTHDDWGWVTGFDSGKRLAEIDGGQAKIILDRFRTTSRH